jgi:hypothetical protein
MKTTHEYKLVETFYKDKVAKRSQVPLINHINEGLIILDSIDATSAAKRAFCLHPLLQHDDDLKTNFLVAHHRTSAYVMMLAMEYRSVANEYLSDKVGSGQEIRLSPLREVNDMLIADKVQNRKDFVTYHKGTHPRSVELNLYFNEWLCRLGVDEANYQNLCKIIEDSKL